MSKTLLGIVTLISLICTTWLVFFWAPIESSMGIVQKIMYIHVPSAWVGFFAFLIAFVFSVGWLWKRKERFDIVAAASAEIGTIFCGLALITGSLWAKPTWNTFWTWDARLTTTLILFLIFCGYLLLRRFTDPGDQQARLSAIIAIIGFLDIPLIHLSVVWWRTLHQPSTVFSQGTNVIAPPLMQMLWLSVFSFTILYAFLLFMRVELESKHRSFLRKVGNLN